jgi:pyrroline-5-carboxylate reductase
MSIPTPVLFIGGGQMARAIIGGLCRQGVAAEAIWVVDPSPVCHEWYQQHQPQVRVCESLTAAILTPAVVFLCLKPQLAPSALPDVNAWLAKRDPLIISVMAGIPRAVLAHWFTPSTRIVRTMPNRPALLGLGVTGLLTQGLSADDVSLASRLLAAIGVVVPVTQDADIDTVTAVSGSGPAYFFWLIEQLEAMAIANGLTPLAARTLAVQTAVGSAAMAAQPAAEPASLRAEVTSKGGTTAAALAVLSAAEVAVIFRQALTAAKARAAQLADDATNHNP